MSVLCTSMVTACLKMTLWRCSGIGRQLNEETPSFGLDVPKDDTVAAEWFQKAAKQGHVDSQHNLGCLLEKGKGVEQDKAKAMAYYKQAADQGRVGAKGHVARLEREDLTLMTTQETHPNVQAVRRVDENGYPSSSSKIIHLVCHSDSTNGRDIVLWDDIRAAFDNAFHVRSGTIVLPFLKGPDFKNLEPLRIAAVPGSTLDVVVRDKMGEKDTSAQGNNLASVCSISSIATATVRRNPAYGLVEEAMDAYRDNENPAFAPRPRGPQAILDDLSPPPADNASPTSQRLDSDSTTPAPQDSASVTNKDFAETLMKAKQGDKEAQCALGDIYKDAQGVPQDYQAAMDWYLKAAEQGHADAHNNIGSLYDKGLGVPQSDSQAVEWYQKDADRGSSDAQLNLAALYAQGQGI
ncbi:hypothetical protein BGW39_003616 [Mortierella sp. 14UC]|nr:hypothetical protein BGW39_003616 [Mortierella sp. 14UC]